MGLDETLDRLAKERGTAENRQAPLHPKVRFYASRIFFGRMLKEINHGMRREKIEGLIDRSIDIAEMLHERLDR